MKKALETVREEEILLSRQVELARMWLSFGFTVSLLILFSSYMCVFQGVISKNARVRCREKDIARKAHERMQAGECSEHETRSLGAVEHAVIGVHGNIALVRNTR